MAGSYEHGDKPSDSGAIGFVSYIHVLQLRGCVYRQPVYIV